MNGFNKLIGLLCERFRSVNRTVPDVAKHRQGPTQTLLFTLTFAVSVRYGGAPGDLQSVNNIALVNFERMSLEDNLVTHHKNQSRHKAYPRPWQRSNRSTWPRLRESLLNVPVGALFPYRRGFRADLIWFEILMPNNLLCSFLKDLCLKKKKEDAQRVQRRHGLGLQIKQELRLLRASFVCLNKFIFININCHL